MISNATGLGQSPPNSGVNTGSVVVSSGQAYGTAVSGDSTFSTGISGANSGTVSILTGNAASGNSGAINLTTGSATGTRGAINLAGSAVGITANTLTVTAPAVVLNSATVQLPTAATDPAGTPGLMYFNTATQELRIYLASHWVTVNVNY